LRRWSLAALLAVAAFAIGATYAADLRQEHGEFFFRALLRVTSASLDAEYSFRALLTAIRLIVGAIGFLAFALLILGRRRSAAVAGLGAAVLACATAAIYAGPSLAANLVTCTVAAAVALIVARWPEAGDTWSRLTLGSAALAGCLALSNFLVFHDWRTAEPAPWGPINFLDQFHYYLGPKYFAELSYDGLYACAASAAAERGESNGARPARDLRTNRVVTTTDIIRQSSSCRARFTPERWKSFSNDVAFFFNAVNDRARTGYTRDYGYNATPLLTVIHRSLVAWTGASSATLAALAMIDVVLFLACVVLISWSFGPMAASLATLAWGTGVLWVSNTVGIPGSMGRLWWVAAIVAAVCLARRQRFMGTGVCLSVAVLLRAFPALFLFVPTILAAWQVATTRRVSSALASVLIGAALGGVGLAVVSTVGVGGISPYEAYLANASKHAASSVPFFVGLPRLITKVFEVLGLAQSRFPWNPAVLAYALAVVAYAAWATYRLELFAMLVLGGLATMFAFVSTHNYDYVLLVLLAPLLLTREGGVRLSDLAAFAALVLLGNAIFVIFVATPGRGYISDSALIMAVLFYFLTRWAFDSRSPQPRSVKALVS
jgi:hypothetical protein